MPWIETGDELHPWEWQRDEPPTGPPTETLPAVPVLIPAPEPEGPHVDDPVLTQPAPLPHLLDDPPSSSYDTPHDVGAAPEEAPMALGFSGPVETKVSASTAAAAAAGVLVWALQRYVFAGDVPAEVSAAVQVLVPAAFAFVAGLLARHTPRPDLQADTGAAGAHALDGDPRPGQDTELPARRLFDPDHDR